MIRENLVHWDWLVYLEMFVAGIAAGAYLTSAILEVMGRGRSPLARSAHLLAFPLMALAGILLIFDLDRPERFWHMIIQSNRVPLPVFKWWSPMSTGSWGVLLFSLVTFVSFLDALVSTGWLKVGPWEEARTLHGSPIGVVWAVIGALAALFVGSYSGLLLSVTNIPGWMESTWIGPLFIATAVATGMAALILIHLLQGRPETEELAGLEFAALLVVLWEMLLLGIYLVSLGGAFGVVLDGRVLAALIGAFLLGGILPFLMWFLPRRGMAQDYVLRLGRTNSLALWALLILIGGFLIRYAVVMGAQHALA